MTWDMHPEEEARKDKIKKAFTGARRDVMKQDLDMYLASDSDEDAEDYVPAPAAAADTADAAASAAASAAAAAASGFTQ